MLRADLLVLAPLLHRNRQENFYNVRDTWFCQQPKGLSMDRGDSILVYVLELLFWVVLLVKLEVVR